MKESSIEEKAKVCDGNYKTYTELINRLEGVKDAIKKQNYGIAMDILCKPYPEFQITASTELKESEDERIRKKLISFFTERAKHTEDSTFNGLSSKEIIAWLEKQKHGEVAIEGQVRDHNFIDFDSSGTSFMIPVPNHNLKCGDKVLVKILKLE